MRTILKIRTIGIVLLLLTTIVMASVQQISAKPEYLTALESKYGSGSCTDCHTDPSGGKSLTDYGAKFKSQQNYKSDPTTALSNIGASPGSTPITTETTVAIPTVTTPVVTTASATVAATDNVVKKEDNKAEKESEKEEEESEKEETSAKSPGFDIIIAIGMLSMIYVLRKHK